MKYIHKVLFVAVFASLSYACTKDKGNYDYHDVNRVIVKTQDTVFTVQQLQSLKINTTLEETVPSEKGSYTYQWLMYPVSSTISVSGDSGTEDMKPQQLSTEKDLDAVITLSPGAYYLQYTVTNAKTNIKTYKRYAVTVNGAFYEGWLVLSNKADNATLSFIRKDNVVFDNLVKTINDVDLKGKGLGVYSGVISLMSDLYVFTDQDAYRFRADDFVLTSTGENIFSTAPVFKDPYYTVNFINTDQYVVNSGKVYATIAPNFGAPGKFSEPLGGLDFEAFPFFFSGDKFYAAFYDNKNKRFMQTSYNSRTLYTFSNIVDAKYDLRNVGKTMIAADRGVQNEYYTVMKDDSGYFYYSFLPDLGSPAGLAQPMENSPDIAQATAFAASGTLQQLYYAAKNKVYLYDILANRSRLVYEFPANTNVKNMQMYKDKGWGDFKDPMFNKRLVVATYNGAEGEVYYLDLAPTGDVENNTYSQKFGGFGDIIQINYRNPNE